MTKRVGLEIRKPGARTPSVDTFVSQGGGGKAAARGILQRAGGRVTRRMTMYLAPELARRIQLYCVESGREISDVAGEALEAFLRDEATPKARAAAPHRAG